MQKLTKNFPSNFMRILEFTFKWEGGFSNDKYDPGGMTKFGISKKAYPKEDIENLTIEKAIEIYYNDYWLACGCGSFALPLAACIFDTAVNMGQGVAKRFVEVSGGDYVKYIELRKQRYFDLINKNTRLMRFMKGWINRITDLRKFCDILNQELK